VTTIDDDLAAWDTGHGGLNGADVLDEVAGVLARYIAFPNQAALHAVTLWAAHAHAVDAFESSPRLALLSPEPGSGRPGRWRSWSCSCPPPCTS
jgi:hypothetical protein